MTALTDEELYGDEDACPRCGSKRSFFDRSSCACDSMHYYCECGFQLDACNDDKSSDYERIQNMDGEIEYAFGAVVNTKYRIVTNSEINDELLQLGGEFDTIEHPEQIVEAYKAVGKDVWIQSRYVSEWEDE